MIRPILLATPLLLGACMMNAPNDTPAQSGGTCHAEAAQSFVGQAFRPDMEQAVQRAAGARSVRVIRPGTMVTMDVRIDRVNVELDEGDVVTAIRCG